MFTISRGSKGEAVRTLQERLSLTTDGDFGPKTDEAVRHFQRMHDLVDDGIVGLRTWAALGVTVANNATVIDPSVVYAPLSCCITRTPNRSIKYLAIHYTAGGSSAPGRAKGMKASWEATKRASADFGVDDRDMVQFNPDLRNYRCWSVGDAKKPAGGGAQLYGIATNSNTISIEICSNLKAGYSHQAVNHDGWYFTEATLANAVRLAKILMRKFNIPIERVVRHYDISGKICPGVVGWNNYVRYDKFGNRLGQKNDSAAWLAFKKRLL